MEGVCIHVFICYDIISTNVLSYLLYISPEDGVQMYVPLSSTFTFQNDECDIAAICCTVKNRWLYVMPGGGGGGGVYDPAQGRLVALTS